IRATINTGNTVSRKPKPTHSKLLGRKTKRNKKNYYLFAFIKALKYICKNITSIRHLLAKLAHIL
ncbi:hypothetical protein, partial [Prevotella pallens]|uniref:hypothetical protein n=1 Tax=Prevotella pallens TaxID=60133 RepID=UPI001C54F0CB